MKYIFSGISVFLVGFFCFSVPVETVQAAGLVTCDGINCSACDLVSMINKIINWLIAMLSIVAVIVLMVAGFKMVTSGGNAEAWASAKKMFANVVIGFMIVLAAWLIVDTIMKTLTDKGLSVWGKIENCGLQNTAQVDTSKKNSSTVVASARGTYSDTEARSNLSGTGISVWESSPGETSLEGINKATIDEAIYLKNNCNCPVTVTGGTENGHAAGTYSHSTGYKIDLDDSSSLTNYIQAQGSYAYTRSDGARVYTITGRSGAEYALEGSHWDVTVK